MTFQSGDNRDAITIQLLNLVRDGPSSFAAIYSALVRFYHYPPDVDLSWLIDSLAVLERQGLITGWQIDPDGTIRPLDDDTRRTNVRKYHDFFEKHQLEEFAYDEVGMWFQITDLGRCLADRYADWEYRKVKKRWKIDDVRAENIVIIYGEDNDAVDEALNWWRKYRSDVQILEESARLDAVDGFTLRDGTKVPGGVRAVIGYRPI